MSSAAPPPPPPPPPTEPSPSQARAGGQAELRSINCTQCGAPLTLHGGHRVQSITCGYCGSQLDAKDEFKLIRKFTDRDRPPTAFELGMSGKLKGVDFTIIGLVQYLTTDGYGWIELALFSPTHGYAWLEQVDGHFVFSRRVRDLPGTPVQLQRKSSFQVRGRSFRVFEWYTASIRYVEGELTFIAEAGDRVDVIEAICPPYIYSIERTPAEEEYVLGEYLEPEETYRAFGLPNDPAPRYTVHPAQPFHPSSLVTSLSRVGLYFTPAVLLILLTVVTLGWGKTLIVNRFDQRVYGQGAESQPFEIHDAAKLLALEMYAPLNNAWGAFDIQVKKDGRAVFSMAKQISYYSGYDGGESWSEGSQSAKAYFKVPEAGTYTVAMLGEGGTGNNGRTPPRAPIRVTVTEGIIVSRYFSILLGLCILAASWRYLAHWRFEARRWSDGDDDDD